MPSVTVSVEATMERLLRFICFCLFISACAQPPVAPNLKSTKNISATAAPTAPSATPSPTPTPRYLTISESVFLGGATKRVYPGCPPQVRCAGKVKVRIAIDPAQGIVLEAMALHAHPLLRQRIEEAAKQWRFKSTMDPPPNLRIAGVLTFNLSESNQSK